MKNTRSLAVPSPLFRALALDYLFAHLLPDEKKALVFVGLSKRWFVWGWEGAGFWVAGKALVSVVGKGLVAVGWEGAGSCVAGKALVSIGMGGVGFCRARKRWFV